MMLSQNDLDFGASDSTLDVPGLDARKIKAHGFEGARARCWCGMVNTVRTPRLSTGKG